MVAATHVPKFFQRSFSRKASSENSETQAVQGTPVKSRKSFVLESSPSMNVLATPIKDNSLVIKKDGFEESIGVQLTPVKEACTPIRLMASTPAIKPSKRCYMSPDDTCDVPTKLVRRPSNRTRSLKFDHPEDNAMNEEQADDASGSDLIPKKLLQSVSDLSGFKFQQCDKSF